MPYDGTAAAVYADQNAEAHSRGRCAEYVRNAIEQGGGITMGRTLLAKDYGPVLRTAGFYEASGLPQTGDVAVIQPAPGHPAGHMAIYDGTNWVSDFKQLRGMYPGPAYRSAQPAYTVFRHN